MKRPSLNPITRISFGLVGIVVSLILLATFLGVFPDRQSEVIEQRESLCESMAMSFSSMASQVDLEAMNRYFSTILERNPELQSVGLRHANGDYLLEIGDHASHWTLEDGSNSTPDEIWLPIYGQSEQWGSIEYRFKPLVTPGVWGYLERTEIVLTGFIAMLGFVGFYLYLRVVLKQLSPSRVVPHRVRNALDTLAEGLVIIDKRERVVLANRSFQSAIGLTLDEMLGKTIHELGIRFKERRGNTSPPPWQQALEEEKSVRGTLMTIPREENDNAVFSVSCGPIRDSKGATQGVIASFEDVTQLERKKAELEKMLFELDESAAEIKRQNQELEFLATRDPLTGSMNRRSFFDKFDDYFQKAVNSEETLSAFMVDIDHFKSINDNHGHAVGDDVLKQVAATLEQNARPTDIVCRYGGEEFSVLLPHTTMDQAAEVAERMRQSLESLNPAGLSISASLGVSATCQNPESPQDLLEHADKCLYVAKRNGRNQVVRWDKVPDDVQIDESKISRTRDEAGDHKSRIPFHAVTALISALAYRDQATANHCRRVADLCVAVAEGLLPMKDCYVLEIAGLLHDIGKIGVPDSILLKPDALTEEEWKIMRLQERTGLELINTSFGSDELDALIEGCQFSHSRRTLEKREVPLGSRILKIVDAFDAMVSDKPYRKGMSQWDAFAELRKYAGVQFDVELVERVIQIIKIRNKHPVEDSNVEISKAAALNIGLQIERLAKALDDRDQGGIQAIASRIQESANHHGAKSIADKAGELAAEIDSTNDLYEVIRGTNELMDLCRTAQSALLKCDVTSPGNAGREANAV